MPKTLPEKHDLRIELYDTGPGSLPPHRPTCIVRWADGAGGAFRQFELTSLLQASELDALTAIRARLHDEVMALEDT